MLAKVNEKLQQVKSVPLSIDVRTVVPLVCLLRAAVVHFLPIATGRTKGDAVALFLSRELLRTEIELFSVKSELFR